MARVMRVGKVTGGLVTCEGSGEHVMPVFEGVGLDEVRGGFVVMLLVVLCAHGMR